MFKSFLISMFAIFLFALGATGAWFYLNMSKQEAEEIAPLAGALPAVPSDPSPLPRFERSQELPAAVRTPAPTADEIFRLNLAQDAKKQQLLQQAEILRKRELRIKTANADTQAAQREVEGVLGQVTKTLVAAEKLLKEINLAAEQLAAQEEKTKQRADQLKELEGKANAGAAASTKAFAELMNGMPADVAAALLKELINSGKMEFAVQLLKKVEQRSASKIIAGLDDPALIAEIATRYPEVNQLR